MNTVAINLGNMTVSLVIREVKIIKENIMSNNDPGQIVVANRNSGTLSVIDAETDRVLQTVYLPQAEGEEFPEPMYAIYLAETDEIAVGDRANDRLVVFNRSDFSVSGTVPLGEGVFHCWADPDEEQLWVTNDIDNTISVVDPSIKEVITTIPLDKNLIDAGGKLHDVILDPVDDYAYVSVVEVEGKTDVVIKYSTETFEEVDRVLVGDDPHLAATASNDVLYVPTQESNEVNIIDRESLNIVDRISIPGAHGAVMVLDRETFDVFYTTNITGEGTDALYAIDTETNEIIGDPVDAPFSVPHNVVLSADEDKLFVTHSGADNNQVSIYTLDDAGLPELSGSVTVGDNPFGLVAIPSDDTLTEDHQEHQHREDDGEHSIPSILSTPDFNGDGKVDEADIRDLIARYEAVEGEDLYHPLYDLNANGIIDYEDVENTIHALGEDVPLLDRQIAQATQATMNYYGSQGLENAIADGYVPFTPEFQGHGIHYFNPALLNKLGNSPELDIERPIGLNYDERGNLIAVFYLRLPRTQASTEDNPYGELLIDTADDYPPYSFDTLTTEDWHNHVSNWFSSFGNLNPESLYAEEDVPTEDIASRLAAGDNKLFPESDLGYGPKLWMLHGWFHSLNPAGTFANRHPEVGLYAPQELGVHGLHGGDNGHDEHSEHGEHQAEIAPLITGTDISEELNGTENNDRMNGFGGKDTIFAGLGNDSVWGSYGNDFITGDDGEDMLYGGPGYDSLYGNRGSDRLFGGTEDDLIVGGDGNDLMRGGLGDDNLTGGAGEDVYVLAAGEGTDTIADFQIGFDTIVLYSGISPSDITIEQMDNYTAIAFHDETLAILNNVNADDLIAVQDRALIAV